MIRLNLLKLIQILEKDSGRKISLKEVADESKCDRNALSRLVNHPDVVPTAGIIDKLVQYFFLARKAVLEETAPKKGRINEKWLMDSILRSFISVYPDTKEYWDVLPDEIQLNPNETSIETLWSIYERLKQPPVESESRNPEFKNKADSIITKLEAARDNVRGGTVQLDLSIEECNLIHRFLPDVLLKAFAESRSVQKEEAETPEDKRTRGRPKKG
ncbi:hypothetical protein JNK13_03950 [bacterium]|nr:hypothetical protein [bacterium]